VAQETSGHGGLYFVVGALVVVVGLIAFFAFGGSFSGNGDSKVDVKIEAPKAPAKQ
jgi:hypothetical protein